MEACWSLLELGSILWRSWFKKGWQPGHVYFVYNWCNDAANFYTSSLTLWSFPVIFFKSMFFFLSLLPEGNCNIFTETLPQHRQGVLLQNNFYRYANAQFFIPFCYCQLSEYSTCPWLLPCAYFLISESAAVRPVPHVRGCCRARAA